MNPEFELLTNLGSAAVQTTIEEYTRYYLINAIAWFLAFSTLTIGAAKVLKYVLKKDEDSEEIFVAILLLIGLTIIFFLVAVSNIPDMANPKATAIHQLLKDARGK